MDDVIYTIFADGGEKKSIAYGSFKIFSDYGEQITHKQLIYGEATSNLAEYFTLQNALKYCINHGIKRAVVFMDSALVVYQTRGIWKCNFEHLQRAIDETRELMKSFDYIRLRHVKRNFLVQMLGH